MSDPFQNPAVREAILRHEKRQEVLAKNAAKADFEARFQAHLDYLDGIIAGLKELDAGRAINGHEVVKSKPGSYPDSLREWQRADRKAWEEYRRWEDQRFPPNLGFKDPPGLAAARRAFEREQQISKATEILRLREASRVR